MKFFKFEEYSPTRFELLPDSFVSRLPRSSDVSNTKILLSCQLSKIQRPTPNNRRINLIIFKSSKSCVQYFVYFNIPCTPFVIWKISVPESHRSRMYFEWSDSSLCGDVRIQNDNFDTSYFSTRETDRIGFPVSWFRCDHPWSELRDYVRTSRRPVGLDTSADVANCTRQLWNFRRVRVLEIRRDASGNRVDERFSASDRPVFPRPPEVNGNSKLLRINGILFPWTSSDENLSLFYPKNEIAQLRFGKMSDFHEI